MAALWRESAAVRVFAAAEVARVTKPGGSPPGDSGGDGASKQRGPRRRRGGGNAGQLPDELCPASTGPQMARRSASDSTPAGARQSRRGEGRWCSKGCPCVRQHRLRQAAAESGLLALVSLGLFSGLADAGAARRRDPGTWFYIGFGCSGHGPSKWPNPLRIGVHGSHTEAIGKHSDLLGDSSSLLAELPSPFGRWLVCHCFPDQACHGHILLARCLALLATRAPATLRARTLSCRPRRRSH